MDLSTLIVALFGAGAGGAVSGLISLVRTLRQGKIDNEETLIKRLDTDNKKQQTRADEAEKRADEATVEAEAYRKQRNSAREEAARLRVLMINKGLEPPAIGDSNE